MVGENRLALCFALDDEDWLVRQSAHVVLTNLTGMEFHFDPLAPNLERREQVQAWRKWWATVPRKGFPEELLELLTRPSNSALSRSVSASSTYKGPPGVLTDGQIGPAYWQTKNVATPQWCLLDLGQVTEASQIVVHQYGPRFVMKGCEIAVSQDGEMFEVVRRYDKATPVTLTVDFPARSIRYVRVTSHGSVNPTYPTTFFEVEVHCGGQNASTLPAIAWRQERGLRARRGIRRGWGRERGIADAW